MAVLIHVLQLIYKLSNIVSDSTYFDLQIQPLIDAYFKPP